MSTDGPTEQVDVEAIVARLREGLLAGGAAGDALARLAQSDESARRVAWYLHLADEAIGDRPWGRGNNPLTAVRAYLEETDAFEVDARMHDKLQISVAREGYLRRKA